MPISLEVCRHAHSDTVHYQQGPLTFLLFGVDALLFFRSLLKIVVADLAAVVATYRSCFVNTPSARDEAFL
jgi:hypothetical protein